MWLGRDWFFPVVWLLFILGYVEKFECNKKLSVRNNILWRIKYYYLYYCSLSREVIFRKTIEMHPVKYNSQFKEAMSPRIYWLTKTSVMWRSGVLQVQRLIAISQTLDPCEFSLPIFFRTNILWLIATRILWYTDLVDLLILPMQKPRMPSHNIRSFHLAVTLFLIFPLIYFQLTLIYDILCSVKL